MWRTALISLQGCGTHDVYHVLSTGHLCPLAYLHCLLGHDRSVSFAHMAGPPGVPGAELEGWGGQGITCLYSALMQLEEGTPSSGQAQPCPWAELKERVQADFQPLVQ